MKASNILVWDNPNEKVPKILNLICEACHYSVFKPYQKPQSSWLALVWNVFLSHQAILSVFSRFLCVTVLLVVLVFECLLSKLMIKYQQLHNVQFFTFSIYITLL